MDLGYFETSLPVKDIAASMAFYEAVGFTRAEYDEDQGVATMVRGDCRLGLFQGHLDPDRAQLIFWQGPVEAVAEAAERAGLGFRTPLQQDSEGGAGFKLDDPDGHPLHFIRMESPSEVPFGGLVIDPAFGWYLASLPVEDMDRSVDFYEALGFVVVERMADSRHVVLQNADCRIGVYKGHLQPERFQLVFWQGDIDALADHMRGAGLAFRSGPNGSGDNASFMLEDPDGHPLFFIRMPA